MKAPFRTAHTHPMPFDLFIMSYLRGDYYTRELLFKPHFASVITTAAARLLSLSFVHQHARRVRFLKARVIRENNQTLQVSTVVETDGLLLGLSWKRMHE